MHVPVPVSFCVSICLCLHVLVCMYLSLWAGLSAFVCLCLYLLISRLLCCYLCLLVYFCFSHINLFLLSFILFYYLYVRDFAYFPSVSLPVFILITCLTFSVGLYFSVPFCVIMFLSVYIFVWMCLPVAVCGN